MEVSILRRIVENRPWRSLEIVLLSGDRYRVGHPEQIWVIPDLVGVADQQGLVALFAPGAIASVEPVRRGGRARRGA